MLYLITGTDPYRIQLKLKELKHELLKTDVKFINYDPKIDDLETLLFSLSFFENNKLIAINLKAFEKKKKDKDNESTEDKFPFELFEKYKDIPENINVIFYSYEKVDKRLKSIKLLDKICEKHEIEEFKPWKQDEIAKWLQERAKNKKIKIDKDAIEKMIEFYGNDSAVLDNELNRLDNFANSEGISSTLIEEACKTNINMFHFVDYLIKKDFIKALSSFKELISLADSPLIIIAGLQTVFRNYLLLINLRDLKKKENEIAELIGIHAFRVKKDLEKLRNIKTDFIFNVLKFLNKSEYEIKSGMSSEDFLNLRFNFLTHQK